MTTEKVYKKRVLVSFRGRCPMRCKHCYTYEMDKREERSISEIVSETERETFDIIYLSQKYENFFDEENGLSLCYELYSRFKKDIFIITRSYLSDPLMEQLGLLNQQMQRNGNQLYMAASICADQSYTITEDEAQCPTPNQRLENLARGKNYGIRTLLLLRPIFPDTVIPVDECLNILERAMNTVDAVIASGLIVTEKILARLGLNGNSFTYLHNGDSEYLSDLKGAKYLDVESELSKIQKCCVDMNIPFFRHSLPALNYLATAN